jgi:hypothetical protein
MKMKKNILYFITVSFLSLFSHLIFAQAPTLGTSANFVFFSTDGAVGNTGSSQITGNVGTNIGSINTFGNVNGQMHINDGTTLQAKSDLLIAYGQLANSTTNVILASLIGSGDTLVAGVYEVQGASILSQNLFLDAKGNSNAVFIFKIQGTFSSNSAAKVILINGALACNVFWKVEGQVSLASGSTLRGTIVANNAAIDIAAGDTLEGRALSIAGAISVNGVLAYTPIGCGSPTLTGPSAPTIASTACYALFSSSGAVTNVGATQITGDIGTNVGSTSGFNTSSVTGFIHPIPDASTQTCASDLLVVYNYLNALPFDIQLLYPAQFGHNLVLTPHTYLLNAATVLTDTLYLNAEGNTSAVFVIQVSGAFSTGTFSKVILTNGTQAANVYWKIDGAVSINNNSSFVGTLIANNGNIILNSGVTINGSAFTTTGSLTTDAVTVTKSTNCVLTEITPLGALSQNSQATIFPNPFSASTTITLNDQAKQISTTELKIYNVLGEEVISENITQSSTTISTSNLPSGIYLYNLLINNQKVQSGRLVSQN